MQNIEKKTKWYNCCYGKKKLKTQTNNHHFESVIVLKNDNDHSHDDDGDDEKSQNPTKENLLEQNVNKIQLYMDNVYIVTSFDELEFNLDYFLKVFNIESFIKSYKKYNLIDDNLFDVMLANTKDIYANNEKLVFLRNKLENDINRVFIAGNLWSTTLLLWNVLRKSEDVEEYEEEQEKIEEKLKTQEWRHALSDEEVTFCHDLALLPIYFHLNELNLLSFLRNDYEFGFFLLIRRPCYHNVTDEFIKI
jgi:hypothetical protein